MRFFDIVNIYGLIIAVIIVAPHIIYVKTHTIDRNKFSNRAMVYIDRTGRFFSLFLMAFNLGVLEQGFTEPKELMRNFWMITVFALTLIYILLWLVFFKTENKGIYIYFQRNFAGKNFADDSRNCLLNRRALYFFAVFQRQMR